jgi:hypothetical protein
MKPRGRPALALIRCPLLSNCGDARGRYSSHRGDVNRFGGPQDRCRFEPRRPQSVSALTPGRVVPSAGAYAALLEFKFCSMP